MLDDTSQEWKELRIGLCGDEDPRSPFWRMKKFGAAGDGHLDPAALRGWQLKFVGADNSVGVHVTGAVEIKELSCEGSGLVGAMLEQPYEQQRMLHALPPRRRVRQGSFSPADVGFICGALRE